MAAATVSRLRWLVVIVSAADGAIAEVHSCADVGEAIRLRGRLEPVWPAHTIHIGRLGLMLATELEEVAEQLAAAAVADGDAGLSDTDRARRDGIAAAAVVVRARADAVRRWAP
jgi:hypothetical protein